MEYNIDFLIAGCNTDCRHCYVNGGPGPRMETALFDLCLTKFLPVFSHFKDQISFTLDHEPYNHPDFPYILETVMKKAKSRYFHHGSTTGIAFNHRPDKEQIWNMQQRFGLDFGSITLHGGEKHHNFITRNSKAFSEAIEYMRFLKTHNGKLYLALMLSSLLIEDRDLITEIVQAFHPDEVYFAIPNCPPSPRLREYQKYRASRADCEKLRGYLTEWQQDESALFDKFDALNGKAIHARLIESGYHPDEEPQRCFLSLHPNGDLFLGNAGVETNRLGNLQTLSSDQIIDKMEHCSANYNFFPHAIRHAPKYEALMAHMSTCEDDKIYGDVDSFLSYYAGCIS